MTLYMTPPPERKVSTKKPNWRTIMTADTGVQVFVDLKDFEVAKHIRWYEDKKNRLIKNKKGVTLIEYLKLEGVLLHNIKTYDYRRVK